MYSIADIVKNFLWFRLGHSGWLLGKQVRQRNNSRACCVVVRRQSLASHPRVSLAQ